MDRDYTALARMVKAIGYAACARRWEVNERTVRRWHHGETKPAGYLARLIELDAAFAFGELSAVGPGWDGWRLCTDGHLRDPAGNTYTQGDLRAALFLRLNGYLTAHHPLPTSRARPSSMAPASVRPGVSILWRRRWKAA